MTYTVYIGRLKNLDKYWAPAPAVDSEIHPKNKADFWVERGMDAWVGGEANSKMLVVTSRSRVC